MHVEKGKDCPNLNGRLSLLKPETIRMVSGLFYVRIMLHLVKLVIIVNNDAYK